MLGNVYKNYNERVKVISKADKGFNCKKWFNGKKDYVEFSKEKLDSLEYICTT